MASSTRRCRIGRIELTLAEEALVDKIRAWLAPTSYTSRYQDARDLRKGSTAEWVFEQPAYQHWRARQAKSATLWIHG
jgi:hypothetical protein